MAVHIVEATSSGDDDGGKHSMESFYGPGQVSQIACLLIQTCWRVMPKERRNVEEVEKEVRRIMERALANFREDVKSFGGTP